MHRHNKVSTCCSGSIVRSSFLSVAEDFKGGVSIHSKTFTGLRVHSAVNLIKEQERDTFTIEINTYKNITLQIKSAG